MATLLDPEILAVDICSREIFTSLHKTCSIIVTETFKVNKTLLQSDLIHKSEPAVKSDRSLTSCRTLGGKSNKVNNTYGMIYFTAVKM